MPSNRRNLITSVVGFLLGVFVCLIVTCLVAPQDGGRELVDAILHRDEERIDELIAAGNAGRPMLTSHGVNQFPLHAAVWWGDPRLVERLLEAGADPSCRDAEGRSPLFLLLLQGDYVRESDRRDCLELLVRYGADVDAPDKLGRNPLCAAAAWGDIEAARRLLELGANVNPGNTSITPLHLAAARIGGTGREMVELLLEHGADVSMIDGKGKRAIDYAAEGGYAEIVALLKAAEARAERDSAESAPVE